MDISGLRISIIGGGIGGLAVARALALQGCDVTILEQASEITEVGAGIQISPNGFAVLRSLGLGDAIRDIGVQAKTVALHDYRKGPVVQLDLGRLDSQDYYFLHRADLINVLLDGVKSLDINVRLGARVCEIEQNGQLRLEDGDTVSSDLVVGADGLHSVLRPMLNGTEFPFFTGQVAWRAVVPNTQAREAEARVHMGPHRHIVSYPIRGSADMNIVAIQEREAWTEEGWAQTGDPDDLRRTFADFCPEVTSLLAAVDHVGKWGLFRHSVARIWAQDALALIGDAAHPTLPFMAQGASMALEDAWVLVDALSKEPDLQSALQSYQSRREDRARKVISAASQNAWKYHLSLPPIRWAAHTALRLGGRLAPTKMVAQFDWIYGHDVTEGVNLC